MTFLNRSDVFRKDCGLQIDQCCDLETMVSRLECTRVHFVQLLVSVSRSDGQGLGLGLET